MELVYPRPEARGRLEALVVLGLVLEGEADREAPDELLLARGDDLGRLKTSGARWRLGGEERLFSRIPPYRHCFTSNLCKMSQVL